MPPLLRGGVSRLHEIEALFPAHRAFWYGSCSSALAAAVLSAIRQSTPRRQPEVIIPAYACPDVVSAVLHAGARPVVADFVPDLPWLDPRSVANAMTRNTVAVLYVRLLGLPANDRKLRTLTGDDGPLLIEDAAHYFPLGNTLRSCADFVAFSFGSGKPVSLRRGGLLLQASQSPAVQPGVAAHNALWARALHWVKCAVYNPGIHPAAYWMLTQIARIRFDSVRFREMSRMTAFPDNLAEPLLAALAQHRRPARLEQQHALATALSGINGPWTDIARLAGADERLLRYPLLLTSLRERDQLFAQLWKDGLGPSRLYQKLLTEMPSVAKHVQGSATPNARCFAQHLLTLPVHSDVTAPDIEAIAARLRQFAYSTAERTGPAQPLYKASLS
jgi:dTDP-4-amino-4,6-dideoxygalactose transaminase